ncbi:hypothetical protein MKX01_037153 [Papaver californicum]|nr:hypothetical protein MKX01_037153 [Papaver californicum]
MNAITILTRLSPYRPLNLYVIPLINRLIKVKQELCHSDWTQSPSSCHSSFQCPSLYYASYSSPREFVRCIGVIIFLLMILTMSFWGATVITSLASAIPVVGDTIVTWLWGGFSVDNVTLNRFFSLHYLLPFILVGASVLHLAALGKNTMSRYIR